MLVWSERFETKIELVDTQHQRLCALLNKLCACFDSGVPSEETVAEALQELLEYSQQHFTDEEEMMKNHNLDSHYIAIHHMEHNSFIYDLSRLQLHISADEDEVQTAEKLVRFITSWLVYHILGVDQLMAAQIRDIEEGMTPEQAYEANQTISRDVGTTQLILNAVLDLWRGTAEHCRVLEEKLCSLNQGADSR
ncbi:MAG: hemerythrin family protein [Methylococcales bacterium]|nr:hemerythrin family protein [Methylococcales bacterium]